MSYRYIYLIFEVWLDGFNDTYIICRIDAEKYNENKSEEKIDEIFSKDFDDALKCIKEYRKKYVIF